MEWVFNLIVILTTTMHSTAVSQSYSREGKRTCGPCRQAGHWMFLWLSLRRVLRFSVVVPSQLSPIATVSDTLRVVLSFPLSKLSSEKLAIIRRISPFLLIF
jgi:hypothetical protein